VGGINSREGTRGGEIIPTLIQLTGGRMPKIIEVSKPGECPYRIKGELSTNYFCKIKTGIYCNQGQKSDTFPDTCPLKTYIKGEE